MRAQGDSSVASLTLLTTMLDFREPGDLGVFIDEQGVEQREKTIGRGGIYPGAELGFVFQTLRANDLIWPNVINNYLKGKSPEAFDLLYWNADATNLPGPMYAWYLRNMYLENNLCVPGKLSDVRHEGRPGRDRRAELCARHPGRPYRALAFGLPHDAAGGRQVAVRARPRAGISPASSTRRRRTSATTGAAASRATTPSSGSPARPRLPAAGGAHWIKWLSPQAGKAVAARRTLGNKKYRVIEPAPGRYVKVRASQP